MGVRMRSVYWWGAVIQVVGTTAFGIASMYGVVSLAVPFELGGTVNVRARSRQKRHIGAFVARVATPSAQRWWQWFVYAVGGVCFLLAGWAFLFSVTNSLWTGIIPIYAAHRRSLAYWSMFFYWWGSVGFCMSGLFYYGSLTLPYWLFTLQLAVGYGLGSFFFFVSSYFTLLWVSNPEHA